MAFTHRTLTATALAIAFSAGVVQSHEFWIEPEAWMVAPGEQARATLRVGQKFEGSSYAYFPPNFRRFDVAFAGELFPVEGRPGDRPAARITAPQDGLMTLVHVTRDYQLDYDDWETFEEFVTHKDAAWVLDAHRDRGLPEMVIEAYSRYAKSLIAVGDGAGEDRAYGLLTEIVALENPYTGATEDGLDVQVFYDGAPKADAQIEIFARQPDGEVTVSTQTTDASGIVTVPVTPGTSYLVDSVVLREPGADLVEEMDAMWESLWASLTFAIPG